jgi:MerR family transcriptional regulator/heat shock protein HspR
MTGRRTVIGFSISIAAERAGMHPQTLREYERKGLVTPQRTPGGARRFADEDVERLRRIQQLTEQGLSLAGVAYVLELEQKVRTLGSRVAELERVLAQAGISARSRDAPGATDAPQQPQSQSLEIVPVTRSVSLEIVHVPRTPRGPRWRSDH